MKKKQSVFKVTTHIVRRMDEYDREYFLVEAVTPESLSLLCPHCDVYSSMRIDASYERESWEFDFICSCPHCEKTVFTKAQYSESYDDDVFKEETKVTSVFPTIQHAVIDKAIPDIYKEDYREAQLILKLSPKASATLSRRVLQNILREEYKIEKRSLAQEIDEFLKLDGIPSYIAQAIDAVRNIGNFAAHPSKNSNTGEIVAVESGEAEWLLEVLDTLFDFSFLQPEKLDKRRKRLNEKLAEIDKPPIKG